MANGAGSGALPSKTVSSHVFQPTTLTTCKLFSISKMHRILSSPPISASQVARQAAIPRSSTRFATCGLEFRENQHKIPLALHSDNTIGPTFQGDPCGRPGCYGVLPLGGAARLKRRYNHVNAKNSGSRCSPYHTRWFQPRV